MSEMTYWSGVACALTVAVVENNYTILVPLVMGILPRTLHSLKQFWTDFSQDVDKSKDEINGIKCKAHDRYKSIHECKSTDGCECKDYHTCKDHCNCKDNLNTKDGSKLQEEYKLRDQCLDFSMWAKFEDMCKPKEEGNNGVEDIAKIDDESECWIWALIKKECEDEWTKLENEVGEYEVNDGCNDGVQLKDELKIKEVCIEEVIVDNKNNLKKECEDRLKLDDGHREECDHMDKLDDKSKEEFTYDTKLNDEFKVTEECNDCSNWAELKSKTDRVNLYNENKLECEDRVKLDDENKKEYDDMDRLDDENKEECNGEYKVTEECNDYCTWTDSKEEGSYEWSELDGAMLYDFIKNKMECDDVVKWDDKTREDCGYLVKLDDETKVESNDLTKLNDGWNVTEEYNDCSTWAEPKEEPNSELSKIEESNLDKESKQDCENRFKLDKENRNECNCMGKLDDENRDECNDGAKLEDECKVTEECNDCSTWANLKEECKEDDITDRN